MNRTITKVFQALLDRRFRTAFLVGAVFGMLFAASDAKAGCAVPYKAGAAPAIPFRQPSPGRRVERACHYRGFVACALHGRV